MGGRYDLGEHYHVLGYVARVLQNVPETGALTWYTATLFTF
jgi:hypothetical protein